MEGWNSSDWGFWSKCGSSCRLISGSETLFVSPISMDEYQYMIFTTLIYVTGSSERHNLLLNNIHHISHQSLLWGLVDWTFFWDLKYPPFGYSTVWSVALGAPTKLHQRRVPSLRLDTGLWGRRWASGLQIAVGYSLWAGTVGPLVGNPSTRQPNMGWHRTISCQHMPSSSLLALCTPDGRLPEPTPHE